MSTNFSTMDMFDVDKFKKEQFRMERLQVFNWGTFSGIHDIAIAKKGFLFVGPSGAGKSTLLDAFSALLVPPRWLDFNAAAHEADSSGRDRNLITYVRGAWAEQEDNDTGIIAKSYLRSTTTWSALALSYSNNSDRHVTLVQIFWIRGNSNNNNDVKRHFLIFERPFEVSELEIFSQSNFDLRKLKQTFPDVLGWDKFRPYGEYFGRLFGIESDLVLRLLHKTQSAKNLGDLNVFLRDFMLDKPETFAVADRLVNEFDELNAAYQAVVTTRKQIETLAPAREQHDKMLSFKSDQNRLKELKQGINNYCDFRRQELLQKHIAELHIQAESFTGEITQIESILQNQAAALRDLEMQHHTQGGDRIAQWEIERQHLQKQRDRILHYQALINLQWDEVDPTPLLTRIDQLDKNIKAVHEKNISLQQLKTSIDKQKIKIQATEKDLVSAKVNLAGTLKESKVLQQKLEDLLANPESIALTPLQKNGLDRRFATITEPIKLDNIDKLGRHILAQIDKELESFNNQINTCIKIIENRYADFIRTWPAESAGIDASIEATADFMAKLDRLELDGLPAHEHRFFELLQTQSHQNLASLATYLDDARKAIMERMDLVNDSLQHAPFNQNINHCTYLRIDVNDRALPEVTEFKQTLHATLKDAWSNTSDSAETRFINLRNLVNRLADQEPEARRWCNLVLDVRQHVEFIGREIDEQGTLIEIYRSGSGKSGGQRQKLATTCLAAALRYQLGGNEHGAPLYAPVILDEAFAKADNDFTRLAMNIFNSFGFQMIVATPLKAVMTLESFIGGACYVEINDRRVSSILQIQYDDERSALKLPKHILPVVEHAT